MSSGSGGNSQYQAKHQSLYIQSNSSNTNSGFIAALPRKTSAPDLNKPASVSNKLKSTAVLPSSNSSTNQLINSSSLFGTSMMQQKLDQIHSLQNVSQQSQYQQRLSPEEVSAIWSEIELKVMPLYNGEGLKCPIEDLNLQVRKLINPTYESVYHLVDLIYNLIKIGAKQLSNRLKLTISSSQLNAGNLSITSPTSTSNSNSNNNNNSTGSSSQLLDDVKLATRVIEIWTFYLQSIVPYVKGCFLPLSVRIEEILFSSDEYDHFDDDLQVREDNLEGGQVLKQKKHQYQQQLDVFRKKFDNFSIQNLLMKAYRDQIVLPNIDRITEACVKALSDAEDAKRSPDAFPKMLQMLTILLTVQDDDTTGGRDDVDEDNNVVNYSGVDNDYNNNESGAQQRQIQQCLSKLKVEASKYGRNPHVNYSEDKLNQSSLL
ncbi:hypothetical protein MIR68_009416 [Amoeboaphelidium protococcarum]|nr:hypothetical protein MIR68_009416 [Amoeboaphelidium protococcarum]